MVRGDPEGGEGTAKKVEVEGARLKAIMDGSAVSGFMVVWPDVGEASWAMDSPKTRWRELISRRRRRGRAEGEWEAREGLEDELGSDRVPVHQQSPESMVPCSERGAGPCPRDGLAVEHTNRSSGKRTRWWAVPRRGAPELITKRAFAARPLTSFLSLV